MTSMTSIYAMQQSGLPELNPSPDTPPEPEIAPTPDAPDVMTPEVVPPGSLPERPNTPAESPERPLEA